MKVLELSGNKWEQSHKAGALDGCRKVPLMLCCNACFFARNNAGMRIEKFLQKIHILVVNVFDMIFSKVALARVHNFVIVINFLI